MRIIGHGSQPRPEQEPARRDEGTFDLSRVLFLAPWFPNAPGDREGNFICASAQSLSRAGHSVAVLVVRPWLRARIGQARYRSLSERLDAQAFREFNSVELIHYLSVPRGRLPRLSAWLHDRAVGLALTRLARSFKPTAIHAHTEGEAPVAVEVGRALNIPVVVTLHGVNMAPGYFESSFRRARFKAALTAADRVVLVGRPIEKPFAEVTGSPRNFHVIPNGVEPPLTGSRLPFERDGEVRFISVSNLHEGKGIDIALQAMANARKRGLENFRYTVVGDGPERKGLVELTAKLALQDKVNFAGACPHYQVYDFLREADVFVLPSYREAFGVAYLEAMVSGLLVIGVEGEGPSAFVRDGKTGFLVPPRDSASLADRILDIARNRDAMRAIASAGTAYVTQEFSWTGHAQRLTDLYAQISRS